MAKKTGRVDAEYLVFDQERQSRIGYLLGLLERDMQPKKAGQGIQVTELRIKGKGAENEEHLIIMKGEDDDGPLVAFHSAFEMGSALRGVLERLYNGTLKWRPDDWEVERRIKQAEDNGE
jgi:hypothetical protein